MHEIAVSVLSENPERLAHLQQRIEATQLGRVVIAHGSFRLDLPTQLSVEYRKPVLKSS